MILYYDSANYGQTPLEKASMQAEAQEVSVEKIKQKAPYHTKFQHLYASSQAQRPFGATVLLYNWLCKIEIYMFYYSPLKK